MAVFQLPFQRLCNLHSCGEDKSKMTISNSNWTSCRTIQGVISNRPSAWYKLFHRLINSTSKLDAEKEPIQVQLLRHDAYNCTITSAWRVRTNQGCWWPIRFENFDIVMIRIKTRVETPSNFSLQGESEKTSVVAGNSSTAASVFQTFFPPKIRRVPLAQYSKSRGHFRVHFSLHFKARLSAKSLMKISFHSYWN